MKVYHFLNKEFGLSDLREKRLKISRVSQLNDPFEFLAADLRDSEFRKNIAAGIEHANKSFGIICFSSNWQNPVQWSHYADRHRGLCLGFDIPKDHLMEVDYVKERLTHDKNMNKDFAEKLMCTKYIQWNYEEEYRVFVPLEKNEGDHYFSCFGRNLKIKTVAVGANSDITRKELDDALGSLRSEVDVFKTRAAFRSFKVVKNKNSKIWV